jgi:hypothetical protein
MMFVYSLDLTLALHTETEGPPETRKKYQSSLPDIEAYHKLIEPTFIAHISFIMYYLGTINSHSIYTSSATTARSYHER